MTTLLKAITQNHLSFTCHRCNYTGLIAVKDLIETVGGDISVHEVARKAKCSECGAKGMRDLRIVYKV